MTRAAPLKHILDDMATNLHISQYLVEATIHTATTKVFSFPPDNRHFATIYHELYRMKDCDTADNLHISKLRKMWIEDYYDICSDLKPLSDKPSENLMNTVAQSAL